MRLFGLLYSCRPFVQEISEFTEIRNSETLKITSYGNSSTFLGLAWNCISLD